MMLSPSEFFILGRIMAAWRTGSETNPRPSWARSLMDTVNHMFYEFGLEYVAGAEAWADVERRDAPDDTAWKHIEGSRADATPLGHIDDFLPGVPTLALGVIRLTREPRAFVRLGAAHARRRTFASGILPNAHSDAAIASPSWLRLAAYAGSRAWAAPR